MADVKLQSVRKSYGAVEVVHGVDLEINDGEFVVFVGPSGCGKSTLLRMIAGLEDISSGTVSIGKNVVNDVSPAKRGVAMVFQTYALYPHMDVYQNMAFGLQQAKVPKAEIDKRVRTAAATLHISEYLDRTPRGLSGGQRQRVAIGRAIVREPDVFLFDEPLSNLDASLRVQTRLEIARLHERLSSTMIYVTHDQVEAMTLADKIVVLKDGCIEQVGSPINLYENPCNPFVAQFIGSPKMNFFNGSRFGGNTSTETQDVESNHIVGIRPEHLRLTSGGTGLVRGKLELVEQLGEYVLCHMVDDDGVEFIVKMNTDPNAQKGEELEFEAERKNIHLFEKD